MTWLNNGCLLVIDPTKNKPAIIDNQIEFSKLSETPTLTFYQQSQKIFTNVMNNDVDYYDICAQYSDLFVQNSDLKCYSLCFELLPICFFTKNYTKDTNFRNQLLKASRLFELPQSDLPKLLCYLANANQENANQANDFSERYRVKGGTEKAKKLLLQIHTTQNIDWWLQELFIFSTNSVASDFDIEFIDYLLNDEIDCGHFFLTMAITLFFHRLKIDRQCIIDYALENIKDNFTSRRDNLIYNILISRRDVKFNPTNDERLEFLQRIYENTQNSFFTVHFLGLISKEESSIQKEFRLAVLRYSELLCSYDSGQYRHLIPYYLSSITKKEDNHAVPQMLQNVILATPEAIPSGDISSNDPLHDFLEEFSKLDTFKKEYCLESIKKLNEVRFSIDNIDNHELNNELDTKSITDFLNENFLQSDKKIQRETINTLVEFKLNDKNILSDLHNINESVVIGMIDSYLDVDEAKKEDQDDPNLYLEKHLFDYIAANGDMPEFDD